MNIKVSKHKTLVFCVIIFVLFSGCVERDTTPPSSTKAYSNQGGSNNDWLSSDTEITLIATDGESGVNATYYRIWYNGTWTSWITYTQPFNLSGSGKHYLEYYSVDNAGNEESVHNQTHYVDDTPPDTEKIIGYGIYVVLYCSKIYFDGTENITCDKLVISPIYDTEIHCKSITFQEVHFVYYDVGTLEEPIA